MMQLKDFSEVSSVYMIGIKGAGMAALATILKGRNIKVTGSDVKEIFHTDAALQVAGIAVQEGFSAHHVPLDVDLIIFSTAYTQENNIEMATVLRNRLKNVSYPKALGALLNERFGIAICGTHGKTTTTALLAHTLKHAQLDPSAVVGAHIKAWDGNALVGQGKYIVVEADEYQNKLKYYNPMAVILTNVDYDHPDFFETREDYVKVFTDFVARIPKHGFLIVNGDDPVALEVSQAAICTVITCGFGDSNEFAITKQEQLHDAENLKLRMKKEQPEIQRIDVAHEGRYFGTFSLRLAGTHNAMNAVEVVALSHKIGLSITQIIEGMQGFAGAVRRFEFKGRKKGVMYFDDYAHHPDEIKATLETLRKQFPKNRIIAIFHPHTFSRTQAFLDEFSHSFAVADQVIILDIYTSAREKSGGVSPEDLVALINEMNLGKAMHIGSIKSVAEYVKESAERGDIVMTMGAGNVWQMHDYIGVTND